MLDGHPIGQTIPNFGAFCGLAVLIFQPDKLGHPEGVADEGTPLAQDRKISKTFAGGSICSPCSNF